MKLFAVGVCLLSFSGFAFGQELDPLGSGKIATYKLEDLPNDLVAVHLETSRDNLRSLFQMTMYSAPYAASSTNNTLTLTPDVVMQLQQVIWVPKQEALHGGDMMVGYTFDSMRLPTRENNNYDVSSVRFRLTYVRRESIISMTPREDFSPERLRTMAQNKALPSGTSNDRAFSLSNLKQVSLSIIMLGSDYEDLFPYVQSTPQLFKFTLPYLKNSEVYKSKNPMGGEFRFNMSLSGSSFTNIDKPAETPMIYESEAWPDGKRGVAFTDGHAKFVTKEEWEAMQPLLKLKLKRYGKPIPLDAKTLPAPPKVK